MPKASALTSNQEQKYLSHLPGWTISHEGVARLMKHFEYKNFNEAMGFVNKVAKLAEDAKHHPDISISYNKVFISLTTHDVNGLTNKDFTLAGKIEGFLS